MGVPKFSLSVISFTNHLSLETFLNAQNYSYQLPTIYDKIWDEVHGIICIDSEALNALGKISIHCQVRD